MRESTNGKNEKFEKVAEHTLRWIEAQGLSKINLSRIASQSGVSRTWIYKYIGSTQKDWITHAVEHFGVQIGRLNRPEALPGVIRDRRTWLTFSQNSWLELSEFGRRFPLIFPLYYRYKHANNPMGERIRSIESLVIDRYKSELEQIFGFQPARAALVAEVLVCVRMSLAYQVQNSTLEQSPDPREAMVREYSAMVTGMGLRLE